MPNGWRHQSKVAASVLSSTTTLWRGTNVVKVATAPEQRLKLYDMEGSPYCRAVREALTALHLDVEIYPCPKEGTRFRPEAERLGGKQLFPLLVDPNTNTVMYESVDIVAYLFRIYGGIDVPRAYRRLGKTPVGGMLATAARGLRGLKLQTSKQPAQLLELWSFESSPYSRLVRERLTELELPYVLHNLGKEQWSDLGPATMRVKPGPYIPVAGGKREAFLKTRGRVQVPYLEDPNTGAKLFESADILDYLDRTYAVNG